MKLLCDAVIVIEAYKLNIWRHLSTTHEIFIGSIVDQECTHYPETYQKRFINMKQEAKKGKVKILTASAQEVSDIVEKMNKHKLDIDPGETESIALMLDPKFSELFFCTADRAAVKAAYLFDLATRVVSLEYCLGRMTKAKLPYKCTKKALNQFKANALQHFGVIK